MMLLISISHGVELTYDAIVEKKHTEVGALEKALCVTKTQLKVVG
jgi:hypothetical protein